MSLKPVNSEKQRVYNREYRLKNRESLKEYFAQYRAKNSERIKVNNLKWRQKNKSHVLEYKKKYYLVNNSQWKNYEKNNRDILNIKKAKLSRKNYKLNKNNHATKTKLRALLRHAFNSYSTIGKCKFSIKYGVDFQAICEHLGEKPANGYHIDHIRPLASFNFDNPEQVKQAFAPENHQWLTAEENLAKGDSICL